MFFLLSPSLSSLPLNHSYLIHFFPCRSTSRHSHSLLPLSLSLPPSPFLWQTAHCSESISWRQAAVLLQWWEVQHWDCREPRQHPAMTSRTGKMTGCSRRTNSSFLETVSISVKIMVRWKWMCVCARVETTPLVLLGHHTSFVDSGNRREECFSQEYEPILSLLN